MKKFLSLVLALITMSTLTARLYRSDDTFTLTNITVAGDLIIELAD